MMYFMFIPLRVQIGVILVLGFWAASFALVYVHPFASLLVALVVGWLAWKILTRKPSSATAAALSQRLASVRFMSGTQFEYFVADIMRGLGYRTQVLGGSGDQGVDVIATGRSERIAIQCKQHARRLGNKPVQEVFAGAKHHGCTKAMVVAPMGYTKGALTLAKSVGVDLHDSDSLRGWIWQIERQERDQANERNQPNASNGRRTPNKDELETFDEPDSVDHVKQYDDLLESYREHLDLLEKHYSIKADIEAGGEALKQHDPTIVPRWDNYYNDLISSIRQRLVFMDMLEVAEAERLKAEGRIARRAELSARQAEIESK